MKKRQEQIDKEYRTADLSEAAALSLFKKLIRLDKQGDKLIFVFPGDIDKLVVKYWSGDLKASIREYVDSLRSTKDRLFAKKREMENKNDH